VTNYRRNFICGGSFFFAANLAERRLRLVVDDIVSAKDDGFRCRSTHPTRWSDRSKMTHFGSAAQLPRHMPSFSRNTMEKFLSQNEAQSYVPFGLFPSL
jgi:hypothetical protein